MFDIGGGSTEYVVGTPGEGPEFHVSTRLGSVRQTERHIGTDPPDADELSALAQAAAAVIAERVPADGARPESTPGSPWPAPPPRSRRSTSGSTPTTPRASTATSSSLAAAERMLAMLAAMPVAERREVRDCCLTARQRSWPGR